MPNTFTKLYVHLIIIVKGRASLIQKEWELELFKFISGIVKAKNQKILRINGISNHVHILVALKAECSISTIARDIKANSSRWINERGFVRGKFEWQESYSAFSVGHTQVEMVSDYIDNQKNHHRKKGLMEEYRNFLNENEISFDEKYLPVDPGL